MTEIWLVRHGETEWSLSGQHTSVTDLPLTENGEAGARRLAGRLNPDDFGLVLTSPRRRATRTAELAGFGDRAEVTEDLVEWFYGEYEGRTSDDIHRTDPGWSIWTGVTPGGETADRVRARVARVIDRALTSGADRVLCFAHGHCLTALTLTWLGLDFAHGDQFPLRTGTVSVLGPHKDGHALLEWNNEP